MATTGYRVTYGGRVVLTVEQAAARYQVTTKTMSVILTRFRKAGTLARAVVPEKLDGRKETYYQRELDALMKARPGKGANLRGASRRD